MECLRLRVMVLDFAKSQVYVRGKGGKDRLTTPAPSIYDDLKAHPIGVKKLHEADLDAGYGDVYLPDAFRRYHVLESGLQKAVKIAVDRAGITNRVGTHTLRHSFATHLLEDGVNIRVVQELMGHADAKTTEIYTHVMEKDIQAVSSPPETL